MEPDSEHTKHEDLKGTITSLQQGTDFPPPNDDSNSKSGDNKDFERKTPKEEDEKNRVSPTSRCSPEPSCAICLGQLQNKSFTDSCFHTFCFTCLLEWSKVKAECPLCKQRFKSIVHNVRSIEDYDQYYIRSSESSWQSPDGRRFRYSSTLTAERILEIGRQRRMGVDEPFRESEVQMHRLIFAPHSVTIRTSNTIPYNDRFTASSFRRRIYEDGLWVKRPSGRTKVRCTSPDFYRQNPACTHRLMPWLNRELLALLYNSETRVMFVLDLILALIMRYDIRSQEFYVHMQPYLGDRTSHFVHEFFNYASSPHDMAQYDELVTYERLESYDTSVVYSSPGSDVVPILSPREGSVSPFASTSAASTSQPSSSKKRTTDGGRVKRVTKLCFKRNQTNNSWNVFLASPSTSFGTAQTSMNSLESYNSVHNLDVATSSGVFISSVSSLQDRPATVTNISSDDEEDDCVVVQVVKPRSQRTPEIINLTDSADDESTSFANPGSASGNSAALSLTEELSRGLDVLLQAIQRQPEVSGVASSADNNLDGLESHEEPKRGKGKKRKSRSKDSSKRKRIEKYRSSGSCNSGTSILDVVGEDSSLSPLSSRDTVLSSSRDTVLSTSQDIVLSTARDIVLSTSRDIVLSTSRDTLLSTSQDTVLSASSHLSSVKDRPTYKTSWYSDSTDISDSALANLQTETKPKAKKKKMKLRSVVGHVATDQLNSRSDSSHHSAEHSRKHKEKHKKKKKHDRHKRHRHRSHSKDK